MDKYNNVNRSIKSSDKVQEVKYKKPTSVFELIKLIELGLGDQKTDIELFNGKLTQYCKDISPAEAGELLKKLEIEVIKNYDNFKNYNNSAEVKAYRKIIDKLNTIAENIRENRLMKQL